jgi:hypothetical protein
MSLWRELYTAQTLLVAIMLEALNYIDLAEHLKRLSYACADSKRKRLPRMRFFSSA